MRESTIQTNDYGEGRLEKPEVIERHILSNSSKSEEVRHNEIIGTVNLFVKGQQRLIPIPSSDPLGKLSSPAVDSRIQQLNTSRSTELTTMEKMVVRGCTMSM
jgi:hypothetical protein